MFRRRLSAALTLGTAVLAITACSTPGTPVPVASDTMPPPTKILDTIKSSATNASAVHIKGSAVDSGSTVALDLQLNKDGSASGTIAESGTTIPLIVANKVYYVQFTKDLMSGNGIDPNSQAGQLLLNKWVPSTSKMLTGSDMVSSLKPVLDYNALLTNMLDQAGTETPKPSGTDKINGVPVEVYTMSDGTKVDVSTADPHYLIRLLAPKSAGPAQLDFTGWNQPVKITPPAQSEIYSGPGS